MKLYSRVTVISVLLLLLVLAGTGLYHGSGSKDSSQSHAVNSDHKPVAQVETITLNKGEISESISAYGLVLPLPDQLQSISVPYTSQVATIQVNQGQLVEQGDLLLTLKPGADAVLQLQQAHSEFDAAMREHQLLKERLALKLATQQDLVATRLRVAQAKAMLKNLAERGVDREQEIHAESSGIIYLVSAQQGQIVPAGAPLLQLVDRSQWVVRLGIEPEDYKHVQVNQQVLITPVNTPVAQPVKGRVEIITHQIDPNTRLVNVFVRPELNQTLLINDFVQGRIIISSVSTLLVPTRALLPEDGGYSLFTIDNGRAVKHIVQIGLENDHYAELLHSDLKVQDEVVVLGNYELESGMAVSVTNAHAANGETK